MSIVIQEKTLGQLFEKQAQLYSTRVFLKEKEAGTWRTYSWQEVANTAGRLRSALQKLGVKTTDRVAIVAPNSPQWVIVDQAALGMGAIVVPLYTTLSAEETRYILEDSEACVVAVHGEAQIKRILEISRGLNSVKHILAIDRKSANSLDTAGSSLAPSVIGLERLVTDEEPSAQYEGSREDIATIIYTSGTTGTPKGVMLSHGNILANCEASASVIGLSGQDELLSFLPLAHAFERTAGYYTPIAAGATIAYAEGLTQLPQNLREINPTHLLTVPRLLEVVRERILRTVESSPPYRRKLFHLALAIGSKAAEFRFRGEKLPLQLSLAMSLLRRLVFSKIREIFGKRIRYLISGGAALSPEVFRLLSAAEVPIVEGYGLTEAGPVVSVNLHGQTRPGTVGRPLPNVQVKLGPDGELLVKSPSVMKGYYKREQDTRETIDEDGWLHTGDLASIDEDGFITIKDRKKEIIVLSGGKNVSPVYVENKLTSDPYILQACVIGDERKHLGALIVPNFETLKPHLEQLGLAQASPTEIVKNPEVRKLYAQRLREINKSLSTHEAVATFCLTPEPFSQERNELTPTLKVRRKIIQEHYRAEVEAMFS